MNYPIAVYVRPGEIIGFKDAAADPAIRAQVLDLAKRKRATRQYRALVLAFARWDEEEGNLTPFALKLAEKHLQDSPQPRQQGPKTIIDRWLKKRGASNR